MILVQQVQAARMLVGWTQADLAASAGIALGTLKRLEAKEGPLGGAAETVWKIQKALEDAGVIFLPVEGSLGPGVRLSQSRKWV
jgi:transcriptional regulator with XRE-family HTH domain